MVGKLRELFRKPQERLAIVSIITSWSWNLGTAFVVFLVAWLFSGNIFVIILDVLYVWTITVTITTAYWILWTLKKSQSSDNNKIAIAATILFMYLIGLFIVWNTMLRITSMPNLPI